MTDSKREVSVNSYVPVFDYAIKKVRARCAFVFGRIWQYCSLGGVWRLRVCRERVAIDSHCTYQTLLNNIDKLVKAELLIVDACGGLSVCQRMTEETAPPSLDVLCGATCIYCGKEAQQIDHVIPLSQGGPDLESNKVSACVACNNTKGAMTPAQWLGLSNDSFSQYNSRHLAFAKALWL